MASSLGASQKGSVNIELNIVPFIDLMSCLTAFLLVTAVWINMANLENETVGKKADSVAQTETPSVGVLLEADQILVTQRPSGETRRLGANDWSALHAALVDLKMPEPMNVEIAAESTDAHPIPYQTLIAAMDTAVQAGYPHVGVTDPLSLTR